MNGIKCVALLLSGMMSALPVWAQEAPAKAGGPGGGSLLVPMVVMFAIFYFLLIRPQQKQQKAREAAVQALKKGDRVITGGGIHGRVLAVEGAQLVLEIADNVRVKVEKAMVTPQAEPSAKSEAKDTKEKS